MNEKLQRFKDGLEQIQVEAEAKARQLATRLDRDGDGDFDVADVKFAVEARVGHVSKRDAAFLVAGLAVGAVVMKIIVVLKAFF